MRFWSELVKHPLLIGTISCILTTISTRSFYAPAMHTVHTQGDDTRGIIACHTMGTPLLRAFDPREIRTPLQQCYRLAEKLSQERASGILWLVRAKHIFMEVLTHNEDKILPIQVSLKKPDDLFHNKMSEVLRTATDEPRFVAPKLWLDKLEEIAAHDGRQLVLVIGLPHLWPKHQTEADYEPFRGFCDLVRIRSPWLKTKVVIITPDENPNQDPIDSIITARPLQHTEVGSLADFCANFWTKQTDRTLANTIKDRLGADFQNYEQFIHFLMNDSKGMDIQQALDAFVASRL